MRRAKNLKTAVWVLFCVLPIESLKILLWCKRLVASWKNLKIPLRGFSFPDREGLPHWEPKGNQAFIDALKAHLRPSIPVQEIDAHINDPEFIDPLADAFLSMMEKYIIQ